MLLNTQYAARGKGRKAHPGAQYKKTATHLFLSRLTTLLFVALFAITGPSYAQCLTASLNISTGYDPITNAILAPSGGGGTHDPHWTISALSADNQTVCGCTAGGSAIIIPPLVDPGGTYSWYTTTTSAWISFLNATGYGTSYTGVYTTQFSRKFRTCDSGLYVLNFDMTDDNFITEIAIDGKPTGYSEGNAVANFTGHVLYHDTVHLAACDSHTLTVNVTQESVYFPAGANGFGLRIAGTISALSGHPSLVREDSAACSTYACIAPITGPTSVCVGSTITLSEVATTGTWTHSPGVTLSPTTPLTDITVTGVSVGTATVTYTTLCGMEVYTVAVIPLPNAGTITAANPCIGAIATQTVTGGDAGGAWTSGTPAVANFVSLPGELTGFSGGTATITYTVVNSCGTASATATIAVSPLTLITSGSVCVGGTITLSANNTGGVWTSGATGIATINPSSGLVTGVGGGTALITYTDPCGMHVYSTVSVNVAGNITGPAVVCQNATITLANTITGTWSSGDPYVSVNAATGDVTGVMPGTATITFTTAAACPGATTYTVTVASLPVITGTLEICPATPVTLTGSPATGTWTGGNASAYVTDMGAGTGAVTAIAAGTAVLTYTDGAGCSSTVIVTVHCPCAALDESSTTLTSTVDYREGCTYTCTAATSSINGWSIAGYLWQTTSTAPVWHPSTAGTDMQTISVPYSGTEVVTVTYYAVDSTGDTCTLVRTINLDCEHQPCYNEDGTNLVVTTATDSMGNCVFTATATVSTTHFIIGYEWSATGGTSTLVHTTATSDSYTFTVPSGGSSTVSVIVHIIDPYFGLGTSPCCDADLSQAVSCGGCKCFDSSSTTITSSLLSPEECAGTTSTSSHSLILATQAGGQNTNTGTGNQGNGASADGCCYKVTVNAGLSQSCTIVSYDWYVDGILTTITSSAASDSRIISIPSSGTVTVIVIIHAIDADGKPCDIQRTITLDCGCHCLNELTTALTYTQLSAKDCLAAGGDNEAHPLGLPGDGASGIGTSAGGIGTSPLDLGCCYNVTAVAGLVQGCAVVSYEWHVNGTVTIVPSTATTDSRIISIPDGTSVNITVIITAVDGNGKVCISTRTLTLQCGCNCFDKKSTQIDYIKLPSTECRYTSDAKDGCCYQVTVTAALTNKCKVTSYIWNVNGVVTTIYTSSLTSVRNISVPAGGIVNISVIITAIDEHGIPCTEVRTLTLTCGCACFNDAATTLDLSGISLPRPGGCHIMATANASVNDPCKVISYTWESSVTSPVTIYTSSLSDSRPFTVPYMSSITVTVTITAVSADGETCTIVKIKDYACGGHSTGCCFDTSATNLTYMESMDIHGNCNFYVTANQVVGRGCRFIGYTWELPTMSTGITTTSTFPVVLPASGGTTITVTFIAINAGGDTCKLVKTLTLRCTTKYGKSAGDGGGQVSPGEQIIVFPNPTDNAVTVSSESIEINTIQVINVNGQKVGNYSYDHAKSATLSLDKLVPGTYMLRINNEISKVVVKDK